jgi:hypothetical protein
MNNTLIKVSIAEQRLVFIRNSTTLVDVSVSTATNGPGELFGSECTPRGMHKIRAKIGADCAENTVFVARRPTGEIYDAVLRKNQPDRDWILTRILWLSGVEIGKNRFGKVDTMRRYIYIHGCPDVDKMGVPSSHGCVKMRNSDMVKLFDMVEVGTHVNIFEGRIDD